jgi:hypothetical protein
MEKLEAGQTKRSISWAEKDGHSWRYVRVLLDGQPHGHAHGCGTNVYERV